MHCPFIRSILSLKAIWQSLQTIQRFPISLLMKCDQVPIKLGGINAVVIVMVTIERL